MVHCPKILSEIFKSTYPNLATRLFIISRFSMQVVSCLSPYLSLKLGFYVEGIHLHERKPTICTKWWRGYCNWWCHVTQHFVHVLPPHLRKVGVRQLNSRFPLEKLRQMYHTYHMRHDMTGLFHWIWTQIHSRTPHSATPRYTRIRGYDCRLVADFLRLKSPSRVESAAASSFSSSPSSSGDALWKWEKNGIEESSLESVTWPWKRDELDSWSSGVSNIISTTRHTGIG